MPAIQQRNPAYKARIIDVLKAKFVKNENEVNYLEIFNKKAYRVNILGTAVIKNTETDMPYSDIVIDDGTEKILLRNFDNSRIFNNFSIGDLLLVIGKPREYGTERYILPEIIKKIDDRAWLKVREQELKKSLPSNEPMPHVSEELINEPETPYSTIFKTIRAMDNGDGADIDLVINSLNMQDADMVISELIKEGVVYEVKAGRIKLL